MIHASCDGKHQLIVQKNEKLVESITRFAKENNILGGQITGLGALEDVELGYYDLHNKEYLRKTFTEMDYELISLTGNIALNNGEHFVHVHASLGGPDFNVFGGHLFEATVAVTAEIFITPLGKLPSRELVEDIGLNLICGFQ